MSWITENIATIALLLVVAAIVFLLVRSKLKERKQGSCGCGCGCVGYSGCAAHKASDKGGKI